MNIKIRPAILIFATGLVIALILGVARAIPAEVITGIIVAIAGIAGKLCESEEKGA